MSDTDVIARPPDQIIITAKRIHNLRGLRGDTLTASLRLEFNEKILGESVKLDITPDNQPEFNFTTYITCNFEDLQCIDDLANKPLLLTVTEILPKEKKQKEEKTHSLGQCSFDLYALLKGSAVAKITAQIIPAEGGSLEQLLPDHPKTTVEIELATASGKPLFSDKVYEECNLIKFVVESLYNPPDALMQPTPGCQLLNYSAALPLAVSAEKDATLVFSTTDVKQPGTFERTQLKKWGAGLPGAQGAAQFMSDSFVNIEPYENETGQLRESDTAEMRRAAEQEKPFLTWNIERRAFVLPTACKTVTEKIRNYRIWPVEFFRIVQLHGQKGKKVKPPIRFLDEDSAATHHGVAYVDVSPLLFPGVKRVRGAFKLVPFVESEYNAKTGRTVSVLEEAVRSTTHSGRGGSTKGKKDEKKPLDKPALKKPETIAEVPTEVTATMTNMTGAEQPAPPVNVEGQQYVDSGSYAIIEIEMHRALVPKRTPEQLAKLVAAHIPPRALFPKRMIGADKAVDGYRSQISQIADLVLEEYRRLYGIEILENILEETADAMDQRRRELMYELTSSGKYYAFKEQIKYCIIKVVREKFLKTGTFKDDAELQSFLSELYIFLMDEMHVSLNQYVSLDDKTTIPPSPVDSAQLKLFADEAERDADYELAAKYHQERISKQSKSAENWFDFAVYSMGRNDIEKADQCLKECLSLDQKYFDALVLYGVVCAMQNRMEEALVFLEMATSVQPQSVVAWCTLSLYHEFLNNEILTDYALLEANRINKELHTPKGDLKVIEQAAPAPAATATPTGSLSPGRRASAREQTPKGKNRRPTGSSTPKRSTAVNTVNSARSSNHDSVEQQAAPAAEARVASTPRQSSYQSVFIQAAEKLLSYNALGYAERALSHEAALMASENRESSAYLIAIGFLNYKRKQYEEAIKFLDQALRIEVQSAHGWALLGHAMYETKRFAEAQSHFERVICLMNEARDMHSVYLRLADIYLSKGMFTEAKTVFLTACKHRPSARTWLGVGISCYRLNELSEAEDALSEANVLNNHDSYAWAYLSLVCLRTNRVLEAEQAYKYAIKTGLRDETLLSEVWQAQTEVGFGNPSF